MEELRRLTIGRSQLRDALDGFGIAGEIRTFSLLTDWQESRKEGFAARVVAGVELEDGTRLAVRFLNERSFILDVSRLVLTRETIENQCAFSEQLRKRGMIVPKKYQCEGRYCMPYAVDGVPLDVTVESWLENGRTEFQPEMFRAMGCLIGQIHRISEEEHCRIGFSILYDEVEKGVMEFQRIFAGLDTSSLPQALMKQIVGLHDQKKREVAALWSRLPRSAVQGDIYSCNNVAWQTDGTLGFYDFNIAGDEVLLGDALHAWFRTVYDANQERKRKDWDLSRCWREYWEGYAGQRHLTALEKEAFPLVRSLLGAIYAARYVAELLRRGEVERAGQELPCVLDLLLG